MLVLPFRQCGPEARELVGGKCLSLAALSAAGFPVPPGFAVTTEAYRRFLAASGLEERLRECLAGSEPAAAIRALLCDGPGCQEVDAAIAEAYRQLCGGQAVAVRSSATAEDQAEASFAGQQETFLGVCGEAAVVRKVRECWASLFSAPAMAYRERLGLEHHGVAMAVGVQVMVEARSAGVMFTLNPTNGDPSKIVIEGSFGLGVAVVGGEVNPDRFTVDKVTLRPLERMINAKTIAYRPLREDVPPEDQTLACVSDDEVLELARLGKAIEAYYGAPQDIEWAIDRTGQVQILQSRPETVWSRKPPQPVVKAERNPLAYVVRAMLTPQKLTDAGG
jgi:pyruvate,water dikinase